MFNQLFGRNHPVEIETVEPDTLFESWINYLRNPNSDDAYDAHMAELHRTEIHQVMRQAA